MIFSDIRKILVLGLGKSGCAAARLARAKNFEVTAVDSTILVTILSTNWHFNRSMRFKFPNFEFWTKASYISRWLLRAIFVGGAADHCEAVSFDLCLHYVQKAYWLLATKSYHFPGWWRHAEILNELHVVHCIWIEDQTWQKYLAP